MSLSVHTAEIPQKITVVHRPLLSTTLKSLLLRGLGPLGGFLLTLLLARVLGAAATGAFYLTMTIMTIFAIIAKFGLDTALQRYAGGAAEQGDWTTVISAHRKALRVSLILSCLMATLLLIFSTTLAELLFNNSHKMLIVLAAFSLIPFTWFGIQAAMLKAVGQPAVGGFFEVAGLPVFTVLLVTISSLFMPLTLYIVAYCYMGAALINALLCTGLLQKHLPKKMPATVVNVKGLYSSCIPLTIVELLNYVMLWAPLLILGALVDETAAGLFNVSNRLAVQLALFLMVLASITAPRFAAYYHSANHEKLATLAGRSTRIPTILSLLPAAILLFAAEPVLSLFGPEFKVASPLLQVLVVGQLVNVVTGPGGYLLAMSGNEHALRNVLFFSLILMLILSFLLIPQFGALGAAWATTSALVFQNLICCFLVKHRLGLPFFLLFASAN